MSVIKRYEILSPRKLKSLGHREWDEHECSFDSWLKNRAEEFGFKSIKYKFKLCYTSNY